MRKPRHICFVVEGYPAPGDPFMPFIRNTVAGIARQGIKCTVLCPQSVTRSLVRRLPIRPVRWRDELSDGSCINVVQPRYVTFSGRAGKFNQRAFVSAVKIGYGSIADTPDALYAHFWHMGVIASILDPEKPLFVACGESKISACERFSNDEIASMKQQLQGVIYVSSKSRDEAISLGLQNDTPFLVLPNGVDEAVFHPLDRTKMRDELGWSQDAFVVAFVGAFNDRKGSSRLDGALARLNSSGRVCSCFIGSGEAVPTCQNVIFCGRVPNEEIPKYLSASDIFVLPTLNEGCCNAIVEALACGLPVVSSSDEFNDDILDEGNSLRVDPLDIVNIAEAIERLKDDEPLRATLSSGALETARGLRTNARCKRIVEFMETTL